MEADKYVIVGTYDGDELVISTSMKMTPEQFDGLKVSPNSLAFLVLQNAGEFMLASGKRLTITPVETSERQWRHKVL